MNEYNLKEYIMEMHGWLQAAYGPPPDDHAMQWASMSICNQHPPIQKDEWMTNNIQTEPESHAGSILAAIIDVLHLDDISDTLVHSLFTCIHEILKILTGKENIHDVVILLKNKCIDFILSHSELNISWLDDDTERKIYEGIVSSIESLFS